MKFAEHLSAHITPEWRKQYIQYEAFKDMLYSAQDQAPSVEVTDEDTVKRYFAKFEEKFFQTCEKELAKINTFYSEKLAEAQRRFATLQNELQSSLDAQKESTGVTTLRQRRKPVFHLSHEERVQHRNIKDLKLAFSEFYLSLILLQNYQNLNFTGFRKILKKHDKILETSRGADWRVAHVEVAPFYTCKKINQLISETEAVVTNELEDGDRQKAMKRLRVPPLGAAQPAPAWTTFRVGLFCGIFIVLNITLVLAEQRHSDTMVFFYLWIVFCVISSCYTLIWDLKMDWGLFDKNAGENTFLREEIVYPQKAYYYSAIIEDVILRFAWTIQISITSMTSLPHSGDIIATVFAPLEVFRRFVWNFFRLENEHLNNCGEFRAVRDISVAPLNADDQTLLEQMMDQEDGVRNRQKNRPWKYSQSVSLRRPRLASQSKARDTKVLIEDTDDEANT
uniref:Xenotropic and polytropic retrovirus receptor 1 n=1 Tax=Ovis aries TaxID=9940 RepID=A0AC11DX65_SHEEP